MAKDIHPIQADILKELLLRRGARFSDLRPKGVSSDQFTFHIKTLVEQGVVGKKEGVYELTSHGKEYANRFDIDLGAVKVERQAKLGVLVVAQRKKGGLVEYVMQQRLKQPFYGYRGFITGKIKWGESVVETAARELEEETGLRAGKVELKTVYHERIYLRSGEPVEDKYFFICVATDLKGELVEDVQGGKNGWAKEKDFLKGDIFYDIADLLKLAKGKPTPFSEKTYTVERF